MLLVTTALAAACSIPALCGPAPGLPETSMPKYADMAPDGVTPWGSRPTAGCHLDLPQCRIAVVIGPRTASSGEAVAVAFRARPEVRFFGQTTAGLATSNQGLPLPDGGALILTTGVMLDRAGAAYPQGISPEVLVPVDHEAIEAAAGWLRSVPERSAACSTREFTIR